jgi:hypothetical protein
MYIENLLVNTRCNTNGVENSDELDETATTKEFSIVQHGGNGNWKLAEIETE